MKIPDPDNEGQEIEVFSAAELAEKDNELILAKQEVEKLKIVSAEKTENFKRLNDMTEVERNALSAEKIENIKRAEAAEDRVKKLEDQISGDTEKRITTDTENALKKFHGGDETLKKALEENFKIIQLEGNDTETINKRAEMAAAMEIGKNNANRNPLMASMGGGAPQIREKGRTDEFLGSDRGKAALAQMGD